MSNAQEKRLNRIAQAKGYRLEKIGKGVHHGRFAIVNTAQAARMSSDVPGDAYSFSLEDAEVWLSKH